MNIYLATPMADTSTNEWKLSDEKLDANVTLKKLLEDADHEVFLPQECDQSDLAATFKRELEEIEKADALVAVLSDTRGVYCEIGYAYALGKPIYGLEVPGMRAMSEWGNYWFVSVSKTPEELVRSLEIV